MPAADHSFLQHLTDLNQSQQVTAREDIYNQFGVLLVPKGSPINRRAQLQLQQHALKKGLEEQVALADTLSDEELLHQAQELLETSPSLRALQQGNQFDDRFRHLCLMQDLPLAIRQQLTVMAQQLQNLYQHCLFTGWAAALIAHELGLNHSDCRKAYVSGLIHDLGLLHLPPQLQSKPKLSAEEWRALQSHVVIGQRLATAAGLPADIATAVLEHHERLDQSGYPSRKPAAKLGLLGQIVAATDLLHKLCSHELHDTQKPAHDALPYFKVHRNGFGEGVHTAIMRILSRAAHHAGASPPALQPLDLERVRQTHETLLPLLSPLAPLAQSVAEKSEWAATAAMMDAIVALLENSGLNDPALHAWLQSELDLSDADTLRCLNEIDAMQYELLWLLKRFGWQLENRAQGQPWPAPLSDYQQTLRAALAGAFARYETPPVVAQADVTAPAPAS